MAGRYPPGSYRDWADYNRTNGAPHIVFIRPARSDFIVSGNEPTTAGNMARGERNPDLAELRAYNRRACIHAGVPGAILTATLAHAARTKGFDIWEAWCSDCDRLVLGVPQPPAGAGREEG